MLRRTRRAPKACAWCHHRKVRCDASIRGCPCTRCRQDGRPECVLRGKMPRNFQNTINQTNPHLERIRALALEADGDSNAERSQGHVPFASYPSLELRATALDRDDLAFLSAKGCLSVPDELDEFIRQYFLQVHPSTPMIDEADFWRIYQGEEGKISLFLFQAVVFAACPYVSLETIRRCGFADKRAARNTLYKRAKTLYDLRGEDRPYPLSQGCVLLALHTSAEEPQISSLWLTRAIQNALLIGRQPGPAEEIQPFLKKRLWWSIILRDRCVCLGLRRRPQVTSFDMGMVTELPDERDFQDEIAHSPVYSPEIKTMLLRVLQEQCRLAVVLSEMITFVFASHGIAAPSLTFEQFHEELAKIGRTKTAMQRWACSPVEQWTDGNVPEAVELFVRFTLMYYQTARIDLAHYEALLLENHLMFSGGEYTNCLWNAGASLRDAMGQLTSIMEYFAHEGRAHNLPLSVLAYATMPLVLTAIDLKLSPSSAELDRRRKRLDALGEIVRHSGRVYDVTDFVSAGTNHILRLAYMTSQHLFLQNQLEERPSTPHLTEGTGTSPPRSGIPATDLPDSRRASDWHEAFLRFPRAYLLISTSVDYSLSVGRLPYDNALPELVRSIPPIGMGIRLPWTIQGGGGVGNPLVDFPGRVASVESVGGVNAVQGALQEGDETLDEMDISQKGFLEQPDLIFSLPPDTLLETPDARGGMDDHINLDYLYIEPVENETDNTGIDQGFGDFEGQLENFVQGFDPLSSSWEEQAFGSLETETETGIGAERSPSTGVEIDASLA
ncbi:hypothetical protein BDV18DRAFT_167664 [Aspergillus unguis]